MTLLLLLSVAGIGIALFARRSLVTLLSRRYPVFYAEVSNPSLSGLTSSRTFRLQRFVWSLYPEKTGDPDLMRLCNLLRILTPALVIVSGYGLVILALQLLLN